MKQLKTSGKYRKFKIRGEEKAMTYMIQYSVGLVHTDDRLQC